MAALLHRLEGSPAAPPPAQFPDVVKSWQITPVGWMLANNITTGTSPTTFSPEDTVTRGQLAAFFYRYKGSPAVVVDPNSPACGTPTNPGDVKNCSDFDSQEAAQSYYDYYSPFYGDVANLDNDSTEMNAFGIEIVLYVLAGSACFTNRIVADAMQCVGHLLGEELKGAGPHQCRSVTRNHLAGIR